MGTFALFVSPGLGPADVAAARARYEAEDEKDDWLDQARVRSVADALMREHGLTVECEDDERPGEVRGVDLERDPEDDTDPDVRVDGWGVLVSVFASDAGAVPASNVDRAIALARSAAHLLGASGIYDATGDRMLSASEGDETLRSAAAAAFARPSAAIAVGPPKGALVALALLVLVPGLLLLVLRRRVGGGTLFLLMFGSMIVGAILASRYGKRGASGAGSTTPVPTVPTAPPPGPPAAGGSDGRPIGPS